MPEPIAAKSLAAESLSGSTPFATGSGLRVALLGNPNTGKTTLFNRLCGLRAKTANFPGTTTDAKIGTWSLGVSFAAAPAVEVIDLPGCYSMALELPEARICRDVLHGEGLYRRPDAVIAVVDASNLARNLRLVGELLDCHLPTVVALNMVDIAQQRGLTLDATKLGEELGCPVVPIFARRGTGLDALAKAVAQVLEAPRPPEAAKQATNRGSADWADAMVEASVGGHRALGSATDSLTDRLDLAFTHPLLGILVFMAIMGGLFWTVFALATVPMDLIELIFSKLGGWLEAWLPVGLVRDLLVEGVVGGVAGTVVFLPQICLLFFLISLLEDTGYLVRAAFVMDRLLCRFGLPGQAFVPLLSSHACALPGIMSTRLIPDRQDRLATILVAPFMSCSARLPVYVLLTGLLFKDQPFYAGLAFAGCYLLGAFVALLSAFIFRRTMLKGRSRPMVLELPSYKLPSLRSALATAYQQGRSFLEKAGSVIVAICIVMWWLSAFPRSEPPPEALALQARASTLEASAPEEAATLQLEAEHLTVKAAQAGSFAGRIGHTLEPLFRPLGFDWQLTVGVLTSFLAREVFVSTMAVLIAGDPEEAESAGVIERVRAAERNDGSPLFTRATAASCLVFFVLAMQCLPTLAVTRRETGSWRWAALQLGYMSGLAWIFAWLTRVLLSFWGVT